MHLKYIAPLFALIGGTAVADDAALLVGIERYTDLDRVVEGTALMQAQDKLAAVGFDVSGQANSAAAALQDAMQTFTTQALDAERIVVGLSGSFATDGTRTWFLPLDAANPSLFALSGAVSVNSVLQVMARAPGQAVLVLGADTAEDDPYDAYLREGIGALDIPQGVTVVIGDAGAAAGLVADILPLPGANMMQAVRDNSRLQASGYAPQVLTLIPEGTTVAIAPIVETPTPTFDAQAEAALWDGARALDTAEAYRNYLTRFPEGPNAQAATDLIAEIASEPNRSDRLAEDALALSRDARRDIQRDLTILNFDPRGIDGIFGPGTRAAITNWQQQNGYSQTTYITTEQINRLDAQAARKAAELEAEAERARAAQLRLDQAFWDETGAAGDEPGLRAYMERYPDGTYAAQATTLLSAIEDTKRAAAAAEDKAAWDRATGQDTIVAYQSYLEAVSTGAFTAEAQAQIDALSTPAQPDDAVAQAGETALGLEGITLRLIEARLAQIGLEPGAVDGGFDDSTRRAIRNFQRDRGLGISGFLNEETIVRLLADGFGGN